MRVKACLGNYDNWINWFNNIIIGHDGQNELDGYEVFAALLIWPGINMTRKLMIDKLD